MTNIKELIKAVELKNKMSRDSTPYFLNIAKKKGEVKLKIENKDSTTIQKFKEAVNTVSNEYYRLSKR